MQEFVLRMASPIEKWNVARFNVPVDLNGWKKPLYAYRAEEPSPEDSEEKQNEEPPPPKGKRGSGGTSRAQSSSSSRAAMAKTLPLNIEDSTKEHAFIGRINRGGSESSNMFLLLQEGNEFKVIPTGDWYHFRSRRSFTPMSLEAAEEQLKHMEKQQGGGRWSSGGKKGGKGTDLDESEERADGRADDGFSVFGTSKRSESDDEEAGMKQSKVKDKDEDAEGDKDELDFEEQWDDDEEPTPVEKPQEKKGKRGKNISSTGKQLRSIIKDIEGDEANVESSDEESEESEREEVQSPKGKAAATETKDAKKGKKRKNKETTPSVKKVKVEQATPAAGEAEKKAKEPLVLSVESVRQLLKQKGQMTIMQLVKYFKAELTVPSKKQELTSIVKSVAKVIEIPPGSGHKFLVPKE